MMSPAPPVPPSDWRVVRLMARIALRRWRNRITGYFSRGFRKRLSLAPGSARGPTAPKASAGPLLAALLGLVFLFGTIALSSTMVGNLADQLDRHSLAGPGQVGVSLWAYDLVRDTQELLRLSEAAAQTGETRSAAPRVTRERILEPLEEQFRGEAALWARTARERQGFQSLFMKTFEEKGLSGFYVAPHRVAGPWPTQALWPLPENRLAMSRAVGLLLAWLFATLLLMSLASQDIVKVGWTMEWLFTLPVSARALMLAQAAQTTLLNPVGWILTFALMLGVLWSAGYGVAAIPLALVSALALNVMVASVRLVAETWMRQRWPHTRLKNCQAAAAVLGMLGMMALFFLPHARTLPRAILEWLAGASDWLFFFPPSLPALLCRGGWALPLALGGMTLWAAATAGVGVRTAGRLIRDGLLQQSGRLQGIRRTAASADQARPGGGPFRGIVGKELRMLVRDRTYLAQTLIVPLLMVGFQLLADPLILEGAEGDCRHAAALAFGVGAYVLAISGMRVLASEGEALWLLYALPHSLDRVMRRKALLWAVPSAAYAGAILAATALRQPSSGWMMPANVAMALVGVFIYAFIAAGIGILATDPLETENVKKVGAGFMYLYLLLASFYAYGLYAPSIWQKAAQVVLCSLVAIAIWQKVRDRLPYLLDPTQAPPPRVGVSDGLIAAFAFFAIQGALQLALAATDRAGSGGQLAIAYTSAGAIVTVAVALVFRIKNKVHAPPLRTVARGKALLVGAASGAAAAAFGLAYLWVILSIPSLSQAQEEASRLLVSQGTDRIWLAALLVLAAPAFEEYVFRGLLLRAMLRSFGPVAAVIASAAIFAAVHPPLSVIPVFGLGLATAISYRATGRLGAAILAHMVYNGVLVAASW